MKTMTKTKPKAESKAGAKSAKTLKKENIWVCEKEPQYKAYPREKRVWQLQEAKAMFSEVVKAAQKEPQIITVHGKETAVILSYEKYEESETPEQTLFEFFQNSPFYGIELDIPPRLVEPDRDINL